MKKNDENIILNGHEVLKGTRRLDEEKLEGFNDWKKLDTLSCLQEIWYKGNPTQLIDYIENRTLIEFLCLLNHKQKIIDISKTNIKKLSIDTTSEVILNEKIDTLILFGKNLGQLTITNSRQGEELNLCITLEKEKLPDYHLPLLEDLTLLYVQKLNIDDLAEWYPNLKNLFISGKTGIFENIQSLSKLKNLEKIYIEDMFGFSGEDFPTQEGLPNLQQLGVQRIPIQAAKIIEKSFKDIQKLEIIDPKSDKWLQTNLNNPFHHWSDSEYIPKKHAKEAFNAYKKTLAQLEKLNKPYKEKEIKKIDPNNNLLKKIKIK